MCLWIKKIIKSSSIEEYKTTIYKVLWDTWYILTYNVFVSHLKRGFANEMKNIKICFDKVDACEMTWYRYTRKKHEQMAM